MANDLTERILGHFLRLAAIPRPSGHEEKIGRFLYAWAREHGLTARLDSAGNVIIDVPAAPGRENAPLAVLQAHMDMVAVSADAGYDPLASPVKPVREGNILRAENSSLGADDGSGIAIIMEYLAAAAPHGPLRAVFTVDEEEGMGGAKALAAADFAGCAYVLNLDNELLGEAVISSAGGESLTFEAPARGQTPPPELSAGARIAFAGGQGGHSGVEIAKNRINAVLAVNSVLEDLREQGVPFALASFDENNGRHNAIPNNAAAVIAVAEGDLPRVRETTAARAAALRARHRGSDDVFTLTAETAARPGKVADAGRQKGFLDFLAALPDGVIAKNDAGEVIASSNFSSIAVDSRRFSGTVFFRANTDEWLQKLDRDFRARLDRFALPFAVSAATPCWPAKPGAKLYAYARDAYRAVCGRELNLATIHAGLETGTFALQNPQMEIISFGPTLEDVHTVREKMHIDTLEPVYRMLENILEKISLEKTE